MGTALFRRSGAVLGAVTVLTLLVACSASDGGPSKEASSEFSSLTSEDVTKYFEEPAAITVDTPVSKPIPAGLDVVWLHNGYPQSVEMLEGLEEAADVLDWSITSIGFDPTNPPTIGASIESAIAKKPDAIIMVGLVKAEYEAHIADAAEAGISLIPSVTPESASPGVYPVINSDVQLGYQGKTLAQVLIADAAKAGEPAHVVQLTNPELTVFLGPLNEAVKREIEENCAGCTYDLLDIKLPDGFAGKHPQQVVSYLQRHPDVNSIVSNTGTLGTGLGAGLSQAGMTEVTSYGISATNVQIEELRAGAPGAWAVHPHKEWGWIIADQVARIEVGDPADVWAEDNLSLVVTAANAADVDADTPDFPATYPDQFRALWGK